MATAAEILSGLQYPFSLLSGSINTSTQPPYFLNYQFADSTQPEDIIRSYTGWTPMTAAERTEIRAALDHIETFLNIRFEEVSGSADPDINFGKVDIPGSTVGYGGYSYSAWADGTLADYDGFAVYDNTVDISSGWRWLILHELGHTLGLKHSFDTSTSGTGESNGPLPAEYDNRKYTLMSYTDNPETSTDPDGFALFDLFAFQDRWGSNLSYNTGDDSYAGPRLAGVDVIWDAGGTDLLDASGHARGVALSLVPGTFSRFGSYEDVAIAYGVEIEHATGGAGHDSLTGSALANRLQGGAGNDSLTGAEGNDTLDGGEGTDVAVFAYNSAGLTVERHDGGYLLESGSEQDLVLRVERFEFLDGALTENQIAALVEDSGGAGPVGTPGDDVLNGTENADTLQGFGGNDRLLGEAGNDTLDGGTGSDTLNGGDGDDILTGGPVADDLRDVIYAGEGNDSVDAGAGNDLVYGQDGNDTIAGGAGVDELQGQGGNDVITGSNYSDLVFGGAGDDFVNGGFGHDRINGGTGADKIFHAGVLGHGSDWVQDYIAADGDVLLWGGAPATANDFQINAAHTANDAGERSGNDAIQEAFVIYKPTEQIIWALVDGNGQSAISIQIGGEIFDLLG